MPIRNRIFSQMFRFASVSALLISSIIFPQKIHAQPQQTAKQPDIKDKNKSVTKKQPNIVLILMDNLGYGEPGCYGGGITRGAPTPNIDNLARQGVRLNNFNVEAQSTPSRSALLTGRLPIRSGTFSIPMGDAPEGLTQWEITLAETLSSSGYATGLFGKWHLGSIQGRLPNDQGFDYWYGIQRTTDESMWPSDVMAKKEKIEYMHIMEGYKGQKSKELEVYDLEQRTLIDAELTKRSIDFMKENVDKGKPFFAFIPYTLVHFPTMPNPKFKDSTGYGDFADSLAEMDYNVGQLMDAVEKLGIKEDTIFIFTSDNGPDSTGPWNGSSGPWRGYYFTHMEGSLRTPFIIRWPGQIPEGKVSNEIVHITDIFSTLALAGGAKIPQDRPIDGVNQMDFFMGKTERSARDGFPVFVADRLEAVKYKDWKIVFYDEERDWWTPPLKLGTPKAFNLITDPKEEYPSVLHSWTAHPAMKIVAEFEESMKKYPPVPAGTRDPYKPKYKYENKK